jgi:uncharacterized membrane protein
LFSFASTRKLSPIKLVVSFIFYLVIEVIKVLLQSYLSFISRNGVKQPNEELLFCFFVPQSLVPQSMLLTSNQLHAKRNGRRNPTLEKLSE